MISSKKLGIWMDHSNANLMEFTRDPLETRVLSADFSHQDKVHTLNRSEAVMHNREQHQKGDYYKRLSEVIRNYDDVLLFGPTDAKTELFNQLRLDHRFETIKIAVQQTDKMTDNQQHAFVKDYFSRH
ncbi:hypothetical protein [Spirosoma utsteinense]|uniref:Translational machinery protein n=1 Tax=Spirosoma utsteinense TaxID=2585773 RepID=A0ABR6W045_9BACT|nr:hypothetical protein [Spirosoma utsteinense]MBC3786528.1 hypothetical protein [Spirosoma utsteinense]MBC3789905.1 hypothetical protein [Spirosoma utsteinense]